MCQCFGPIRRIYVTKDQDRDFAFVAFCCPADAELAIAGLHSRSYSPCELVQAKGGVLVRA